MSVNTEAYRPSRETRGEVGHQPVGPFFGKVTAFGAGFVGVTRTVAQRAMFVVATVIDTAVEQIPLTVLDESLGGVLF